MVIHHPGGKIHDASPWYSMFRNKYLLFPTKLDIQTAHFIMEMCREQQSIALVQSIGAAKTLKYDEKRTAEVWASGNNPGSETNWYLRQCIPHRTECNTLIRIETPCGELQDK